MEKEITYYSRGIPLAATVAFSEEDLDRARPAVVLCHGHGRYRNDGLDRLSQHLTEAGFLTLRMDFRGCGSQAAQRHFIFGQEWCEDLMNAISYLKNLPMADPRRIGVAGISMGASTAVYVTGMDKRIKSTVSMAGVSDFAGWMEDIWRRKNGDFPAFLEKMEEDSRIAAATGRSSMVSVGEMFHMTAEELRELQREAFFNKEVGDFVPLSSVRSMLYFKPVEKCPNIHTPIFFCYGAEDAVVPGTESKRLYEAVPAEKKRLKCYEGMEHNMPVDPRREALFADITQWFLETL